jgi:chromosome partitioning protein
MVIASCNQKGGTGKTVTAIELSCGLANSGQKTLLIDLDPQAHATVGMGIELERGQPSIKNALVDQQMDLVDVSIKTKIENLSIVPSDIRLSAAAEQLYTKIYREQFLSKGLQPIKDLYSYIIVDCPPNLGVLTVNAINASDLLIIPCQMSRYSLDGIADLLDTIEQLKGQEFVNFRILLTMMDLRNKTTNQYILDQLKDFEDKILKTRIMRSEALNQARIVQDTIINYDPKGRGSENYNQLTQEILAL